MKRILAVILAGGKGTRLEPLTRDRAKPAVPFGGVYRIIDFTLSNCLNSGLRKILLLTQYKAQSLDRHIQRGWKFLSRELGEHIDVLPPQQRIDEHWYQGTADALYQNIYTLEQEKPQFILVLAGDHIYKMDYGEMFRFHLEREADLTIGCLKAPTAECRHFGVMQVDAHDAVAGFVEKPAATPGLPDAPEHFLASMGIYIFRAALLYDLLCEDAAIVGSGHDFGKDILPRMIGKQRVFAYRYAERGRAGPAYWRDVGTLDAYYQANMDLVAVEPELNLYGQDWPIRTHQPQLPPAKFVHGEEGLGPRRRGEAIDSMVCAGCIVSGGQVRRSILSPNVRVNSYASVEQSILLHGVDIGRHARVRRAIIDKDVKVPPHAVVGYDAAEDRRRGFTVTEQGVVVVSRGELPETFLS